MTGLLNPKSCRNFIVANIFSAYTGHRITHRARSTVGFCEETVFGTSTEVLNRLGASKK